MDASASSSEKSNKGKWDVLFKEKSYFFLRIYTQTRKEQVLLKYFF